LHPSTSRAQAWTRADALRYGENPHQKAALYTSKSTAEGSSGTESGDSGPATLDPGIANAEVLHGKAMSYNNYVDADAARRAAYDRSRRAAPDQHPASPSPRPHHHRSVPDIRAGPVRWHPS